jgi:trimeric autotransporter adhesin
MRTVSIIVLFAMLAIVCLPSTASDQPTLGLPLAAQSAISTELGRDIPGYHIQLNNKFGRAQNSQHDLEIQFMPKGVEITSKETRWCMSLSAYGRGDTLKNIRAVAPQVSANRVEYRRGSITEWYVNGPAGLEQGFTIRDRPQRRRGQPLTLVLSLSGNLMATLGQNGTDLTLKTSSHNEILRYAELASSDSTGKQLPTWMELHGDKLRIRVNDAGAVYPVVVDPWVRAARLTVTSGSGFNFFGESVSVSGDGSLIAIGVQELARIPPLPQTPGKDAGTGLEQGAVYLFVQPAKGWATTSKPAAKLTDTSGEDGDLFGCSVAVSSDGKTVVVGAEGGAPIRGNSQLGAVYVFTEPTTGWVSTSTPTAKLTASDGIVTDWLGSSVAFDGQSVFAGAYGHTVGTNPYQGAVYVYTEPSTGWADMTQTAELAASDGQPFDLFGFSVSANSGVAVAGTIQATVNSNSSQGAAYLYVAPSTGWVNANENAKLLASDGIAEDFFGSAVAISSDTTLVVAGAQGATVNGNGQGAAYVFVEPTGGWTGTLTETAKLTASDGVQDDYFGAAVAVSSDDNTIVVGAPLAPYSNTQQYTGPGSGRVYNYAKPSGGWVSSSTYSQELAVPNQQNGAQYGGSVAIGATALAVGAPSAKVSGETNQGATFISVAK